MGSVLQPLVSVGDWPAERLERATAIFEMRNEAQESWQYIAHNFGLSIPAAKKDYEIILNRTQIAQINAIRMSIAADLDELQRRAQEIMDRQHVVVSQGHVVSEIIGQWPMIDVDGVALTIDGPDGKPVKNPFAGVPHPKAGEPIYGEPLRDSMPELAAIKEVRAIIADKRKMFGIDAPTQISADVKVNFAIEGVNMDAMK